MPPIATLAILTFVGTWNAYLWPFLIGKDESVRVLTVALEEVSAKVRRGGPIDDEADYALPVWAGVVPVSLQRGAPIPDPAR